MPDNSSEKNIFKSPIGGASTCLPMAACAALGAALRGNNVHNEAITMLVGGVQTGAMAGFLGMCVLPKITEESSLCTQVFSWLLTLVLEASAISTAPLIADAVEYPVDNEKDTVVDTFYGAGVISAVVVVLGVACCGVTVCCSSLFSGGNGNAGEDSFTSKLNPSDIEPDLESGSVPQPNRVLC